MTAIIARRQQRWEAAETTLQEGLTLAQRMGYPYWEARLLQRAKEQRYYLVPWPVSDGDSTSDQL
jgi:hypothetical protein